MTLFLESYSREDLLTTEVDLLDFKLHLETLSLQAQEESALFEIASGAGLITITLFNVKGEGGSVLSALKDWKQNTKHLLDPNDPFFSNREPEPRPAARRSRPGAEVEAAHRPGLFKNHAEEIEAVRANS
jgi:hypothetical protein